MDANTIRKKLDALDPRLHGALRKMLERRLSILEIKEQTINQVLQEPVEPGGKVREVTNAVTEEERPPAEELKKTPVRNSLEAHPAVSPVAGATLPEKHESSVLQITQKRPAMSKESVTTEIQSNWLDIVSFDELESEDRVNPNKKNINRLDEMNRFGKETEESNDSPSSPPQQPPAVPPHHQVEQSFPRNDLPAKTRLLEKRPTSPMPTSPVTESSNLVKAAQEPVKSARIVQQAPKPVSKTLPDKKDGNIATSVQNSGIISPQPQLKAGEETTKDSDSSLLLWGIAGLGAWALFGRKKGNREVVAPPSSHQVKRSNNQGQLNAVPQKAKCIWTIKDMTA